MCTVTVYQDDAGFLVTMNRDEARSRGSEVSPQHHQPADAPDWVAPLDSDKGGTWMGVNEYGVAACLLNRYQDCNTATPPRKPKSRGAIIPMLLKHQSVEQCRDWLQGGEFTPTVYPSFTVLLVDPHGGTRLDWRGTGSLSESDLARPWHMATSSFMDAEAVLPWRESAFSEWLKNDAPFSHDIPVFHLHQPKGMAKLAPLMSRDISCTRSITQVALTRSEAHIVLRHASVVERNVNWEQFSSEHRLDYQTTFPAGDRVRETPHG